MKVIAIAIVLLFLIPAPAVLAWSNCGTPKAESDCEAHGLPGKPAPAATPPAATPVLESVTSLHSSGGAHGDSKRVAICHNEDDQHGQQSMVQRNVLPERVKFYLSSASGLDYLMDTAIGNCGPTTP